MYLKTHQEEATELERAGYGKASTMRIPKRCADNSRVQYVYTKILIDVSTFHTEYAKSDLLEARSLLVLIIIKKCRFYVY